MSTATMLGTRYVCAGCGTQYDESAAPPTSCVICTDDRQYVGSGGQNWTTVEALTATNANRIERDGDLLGVGLASPFAIPQRALLVTAEINVLWDCVSLVTAEAVDELSALGGVDAIAISHPHFYSSMIDWSDAFGGVPIHLHHADASWVQRRSPNIHWWSGDGLELTPTVRLVHLPGHFPGSAALHRTDEQTGRGVLLAGDSLHVADDRRHVTVMYSVPNYIPVGAGVISDLRARLAGIEFDDLYGFTWGRNIIGGARAAVDRSFDRYLRHVTDSTVPERIDLTSSCGVEP